MGNSYTRQSSAEIVDGNIVEATPINNEFNALQSAFDGTLGHTHDGTVGEGPKINLTNSVTGVLPVANGGVNGINKINATTAPTTGDDADDGYAIGSLWVDTTNKIIYFCVDNTPGAAVWRRHQQYSAALASISGLTTVADRMIYTTGSDIYAVTALTPFARTVLDDTDASAMLSTLGVSAFIKTFLDDPDASTAQTTLGISTFIKTLLDDADAATARATLGVVIGTNVQAQDPELQALAGLTSAADKLPYFTGSGSATLTDFTSAGRALVDDPDAAAQRTTLGLGTVATQNSNSMNIDHTAGTIGSSVTAVTQTTGDNSTKIATTAYVDSQVGGIVSIPPAMVAPFYRSTAPAGWLICDGSAVSRTTYATLWSAMGSPNTGNGTTTFTLPDLRAEFIRGLDNGRGVDTSRGLGTTQTDAIKSHTHSVTESPHSHSVSGSTDSQGAHTHSVSGNSAASGLSGTVVTSSSGSANSSAGTSSAGSHSHNVSGSTNAVSTGISIQSTGGTENLVRNVALLYCIKT